jgi:hypothetical protein
MKLDEIGEAVVRPWVEKRTEWVEANQREYADAILEEDAELVALTRGMLDGYLQTFRDDVNDFEVLAVEPQVARWLVHPKTGKPVRDRITIGGKRTFRRWAYGGAMDLLVRLKDGTVWFMEHKTTSERDLQSYVRKLDWDPQIKGYAWAAADPVDTGCSTDVTSPLRITGVIYNVARKKVPVEPEPLKGGGLSKARGIDTTRAHYLNAILRNGLNPDAYADVLEQLQSAKFFHREHIVFTDSELDDFGQDVSHAALQVMRAEGETHHPRQTKVCIGTAVMPCPYKEICLHDGPMMRKAFSVTGIRHTELTGVLAEDYVGKMRNVSVREQEPRALDSGQVIVQEQSTRTDTALVDPFAEFPAEA